MTGVTPDTSVVIAGLSSWHPDHDLARPVLADKPPILAHVLSESYSVLTRLPAPRRLDPIPRGHGVAPRLPRHARVTGQPAPCSATRSIGNRRHPRRRDGVAGYVGTCSRSEFCEIRPWLDRRNLTDGRCREVGCKLGCWNLTDGGWSVVVKNGTKVRPRSWATIAVPRVLWLGGYSWTSSIRVPKLPFG